MTQELVFLHLPLNKCDSSFVELADQQIDSHNTWKSAANLTHGSMHSATGASAFECFVTELALTCPSNPSSKSKCLQEYYDRSTDL